MTITDENESISASFTVRYYSTRKWVLMNPGELNMKNLIAVADTLEELEPVYRFCNHNRRILRIYFVYGDYVKQFCGYRQAWEWWAVKGDFLGDFTDWHAQPKG